MKAPPAHPLLIVVLAGAATLGFTFLFFLPQQQAIARYRADLSEQREYILTTHDLAPRTERARDDLQAARAHVRRWRQAAPRGAERATLFAAITGSAEAAGVRLLRCDPGEAESLDALERAQFTLEVEGEFAQIYRFLSLLEALPQTHWTDYLSIEAARHGAERLRCELRMTVFADRGDFSDQADPDADR